MQKIKWALRAHTGQLAQTWKIGKAFPEEVYVLETKHAEDSDKGRKRIFLAEQHVKDLNDKGEQAH